MNASNSQSIPPEGPIVVQTGQAGDLPDGTRRSARLISLTVAVGVVAGLAAWAGGEACLDRIKPPRHAADSKGLVLNLTDRREVARAEAQNAGVAFAILGGALGAGLGMAGGLRRGSVRAAATAGLVGLVVGTAGGAVSSLALLPRYNEFKARNPDLAARDLVFPLLVHAAVWSVVGASAGLAYAVGLGHRHSLARIILGGLAGAALGSILYELIGAGVFPEAQTSRFVSTTWQTRLFARLAVTIVASVGVALAAGEPSTRTGPTAN